LPEPVQAVSRSVPFELERHESGGERGFDLGRAPLMRVAVMELGEGRQRVVWSMHHVLLDGWSTAMVLEELSEVYGALLEGRRAPERGRRRRFREHVGWVRAQDGERAREYWRGLLGRWGRPTSCRRTAVRREPRGRRPGSSRWS